MVFSEAVVRGEATRERSAASEEVIRDIRRVRVSGVATEASPEVRASAVAADTREDIRVDIRPEVDTEVRFLDTLDIVRYER